MFPDTFGILLGKGGTIGSSDTFADAEVRFG